MGPATASVALGATNGSEDSVYSQQYRHESVVWNLSVKEAV